MADFEYYQNETQRTIVEDCKGFKTRVYSLNRKLFEAIYNLRILET